MARRKDYYPSLLERQCLKQLDDEPNWRYLKKAKPSHDTVLGWGPFRTIFRLNIGVFSVVFGGLFFAGAYAVAQEDKSQPEWGWAAGLTVLSAIVLSGISANLYRRSWNRRARALIRQAEEERDLEL